MLKTLSKRWVVDLRPVGGTEACCEPDCGPGACATAEVPAQKVPVVAGASDSCCEPDCGPGACS